MIGAGGRAVHLPLKNQRERLLCNNTFGFGKYKHGHLASPAVYGKIHLCLLEFTIDMQIDILHGNTLSVLLSVRLGRNLPSPDQAMVGNQASLISDSTDSTPHGIPSRLTHSPSALCGGPSMSARANSSMHLSSTSTCRRAMQGTGWGETDVVT